MGREWPQRVKNERSDDPEYIAFATAIRPRILEMLETGAYSIPSEKVQAGIDIVVDILFDVAHEGGYGADLIRDDTIRSGLSTIIGGPTIH